MIKELVVAGMILLMESTVQAYCYRESLYHPLDEYCDVECARLDEAIQSLEAYIKENRKKDRLINLLEHLKNARKYVCADI